MRDFCIATARELATLLLSPVDCVLCGKIVQNSYPLCPECAEKLLSAVRARARDLSQSCDVCGVPLISTHTLCMKCRTLNGERALKKIFPLLPYSASVQDLLVTWKIGGIRGFTRFFADLLDAFLRNGPDLERIPLVPVPPRPGKIAERGWDQIQDLSRYLSRERGYAVYDCLQRTASVEQKKLGRADRFANISGAIVAKGDRAYPREVIVLDDLVTTGATLEACARALKAAGCETVYGLTLFFD